MTKLKEKFGKYFQFKNTINGMSYFLRGLATILFLIPMAILIGIGIGIISAGGNAVVSGILILIGCLFFIPLIWFSLATTYKRINAFFPKQATLLTILTFLWSGIGEVFNPNSGVQPGDPFVNPASSPIYIVIILVGLIWSFYLLFGNSKVKKHIG